MSDAHSKGLAKCGTSSLRVTAEIGARARFVTMRKALFRTQLDAAVALGVDDSSVERWEQGVSKVPAWANEALVLLAEQRKAGGQ